MSDVVVALIGGAVTVLTSILSRLGNKKYPRQNSMGKCGVLYSWFCNFYLEFYQPSTSQPERGRNPAHRRAKRGYDRIR